MTRHPMTPAERRADRFWPLIGGPLIIGGIWLTGLIEGGAIG